MGGLRRRSGWRLAVPALSLAIASPVLGQTPGMSPLPAASSGVEIYYGTRPVPRPVVSVRPVPMPELPLVVPAIAQTPTPISPEPMRLPPITAIAAEPERLPEVEPDRTMSPDTAQILERISDRLLASAEIHRRIATPPVPAPPQPLLPEAVHARSTPGSLPIMTDVTPLERPTAAPALPVTNAEVVTRGITLTPERLLTALGLAVGVAGGLGFALVLALFLRRPASPSRIPREQLPPSLLGPTPLVVSEKGLPKVAESVSQSRPTEESAGPERFDPSMFQDAPPARPTVEPRRPRTEEAMVQFILDQNLAVLSAMGPSRPSELNAPVRIG